jgi:Yip1-like protein
MNLVERVKNILLTPKTEWPVIERETGDTAFLFKNYVAILAAIPAVCGFIGSAVIGAGGYRAGFFRALIGAIIGYVLAFVGVYVMALIVNALAPSFSGRKDFGSALKLVVYSSTAAWVAGIFSLIPALAVLSILGLYSLYLLYLGLPVLMKSPPERSLVYTIVIIVCAILTWMVISIIPASLLVWSLAR